MNSILQKNEFIHCPNCANLIGSFSPVCSKCGLETSQSGVEELAEIDDRNRRALNEAENLLMFAMAPIGYLGLAYFVSKFIPEAAVTFTAIAVIGVGMFWWKYVGWHRRYSGNLFPDDAFTRANRTKSVAGIWGIIITLLICLFTYSKVT